MPEVEHRLTVGDVVFQPLDVANADRQIPPGMPRDWTSLTIAVERDGRVDNKDSIRVPRDGEPVRFSLRVMQ